MSKGAAAEMATRIERRGDDMGWRPCSTTIGEVAGADALPVFYSYQWTSVVPMLLTFFANFYRVNIANFLVRRNRDVRHIRARGQAAPAAL